MRKLIILFALGLSACQSLTPQQEAALACVVSGGVVQAVMASQTAASAVAAKYSGSQVVACNTAVQVGSILGAK